MTAILGGLVACVCWSCSALCATAASRALEAGSTLAWITGFGLAVLLLPLALFASVRELSVHVVALLAIVGLTNVMGLALQYRAFKLGKVGVVTAIASTEGMAATLIAMAAGAAVSATVFVVLLLITAGVVLAAADQDAVAPETSGDLRELALLSLPVPVVFGISLFAAGEVGPRISVLWVILPTRLVGALLIGAPMLCRGRLRVSRPVLPLLAAAGVAEVLGYAAYVWGSHAQLSVAAVLASEYAALATVGAYFLFGERLKRKQIAGLAVMALGVGMLGLLHGA